MRQSRKKLQQRAIAKARKMAKPHCGERSCLDWRLSQAWLAGYEAARRDARKPLKVSDIVDVTVGPLTSGGKALDMRGALLCGDHGIEGPTGPRGVSPARVRNASNPTAFSIVSTDDGQGEVLTIPALGSRQITCVACGWPCNSVGTCSNLGCPGLGGDA